MKDWARDMGDSLTLGFQLVLPTLLGALLGYYADRYFSSGPVGLILGVFLGAGLGGWSVVRAYLGGPSKKEKR